MGARDSKALVATLGAVVLAVTVMQSGIVPVLASIRTQLQVSVADSTWVVTANLLAAAAAVPLIGRLADVFNKKTVLLGTLAVVLAGSVLGAVTSSLPLLVFARGLQGTSYALYPVAVSILRSEIPADRLIRRIAAVSAMLGLGAAAGLLATGSLMSGGVGYHRVFWVHTALTLTVLVVAAAVVPNRSQRVAANVDWVGAAGLALGLSGVLLAVSKGSTWGWEAPQTVISALIGVIVLVMWARWTRRVADPLVSLEVLKRRPVRLANAASFLTGMGSYISFLGLSHFVEVPGGRGFGFGATVSEVSLMFLLPGALVGTVTAVVAGRAIERFGARAVVAVGGVTGVLGFAMLAFVHSYRWEVMVAGMLTNTFLSLSYGALPAMIVGEVAPSETGIATSLNGTFSKAAGATAAALLGSLLTPVGSGHPAEISFTTVFIIGVAAAGTVVVLASLGRTRGVRRVRMPRVVPMPRALAARV